MLARQLDLHEGWQAIELEANHFAKLRATWTILQWEDWHAHLAGESQGNDFLHEQAGMDTNSDLMFGNLGADTF